MSNEPSGVVSPAQAPASRRQDLLIAAVLAAVVFGWNLTIERALDRQKVLSQFDVLFNADPITRLDSISNGKGDPNDLIIHPGFKVYFSRPIRLAGKAARAGGLIADRSRDEYDLRRSLALLVVPAVSGLTMAAAYGLFLAGGLTRPGALLMTLICCASFSQLVFGSLPDHMPVSALCVTALLALALDLVASGGKVRRIAWPLAGGLYAATTVTNAAPFVVLLTTSLALAGLPPRRVVRDAVLVTLSAVAVTGGLALAGRAIAKDTPWPVDNVQHHAKSYQKRDWDKVPAALLETFSPPALVTADFPPNIRRHNQFSSGRDTPGVTVAPATSPALPAVVTALTIAGAIACVRAGNAMRVLGAASAGVVAFNLTLHSLWGDSFFLYSQHWLVPLAVLLAGNLTWPGRAGRACFVLYAAAGVAMFFHNGALLTQIFRIVGGSPT